MSGIIFICCCISFLCLFCIFASWYSSIYVYCLHHNFCVYFKLLDPFLSFSSWLSNRRNFGLWYCLMNFIESLILASLFGIRRSPFVVILNTCHKLHTTTLRVNCFEIIPVMLRKQPFIINYVYTICVSQSHTCKETNIRLKILLNN